MSWIAPPWGYKDPSPAWPRGGLTCRRARVRWLRMRQHSVIFCALLSAILAAVPGCTDNQIGRPCNSLGKSPASGVSFVNPAPDCPSRLCMVTPPPATITPGAMGHDTPLAMCTASCETDDDCGTSGDFQDATRCTKYVCAVPSVVPGAENFCCQKLCMCADDRIPGFNVNAAGSAPLPKDDAGTVIPTACTN